MLVDRPTPHPEPRTHTRARMQASMSTMIVLIKSVSRRRMKAPASDLWEVLGLTRNHV